MMCMFISSEVKLLPQEVASFPRTHLIQAASADQVTEDQLEIAHKETRLLAILTITILAGSILFSFLYLLLRRSFKELSSYFLLSSIVLLLFTLLTGAIMNLRYPEVNPLIALGFMTHEDQGSTDPEKSKDKKSTGNAPFKKVVLDPLTFNWKQKLRATGKETDLGDALQALLGAQQGEQPIAGIVVYSDGRNNQGRHPSDAAAFAGKVEIPIYTIGLGSVNPPKNLRLVSFTAPKKVFPNNEFRMQAEISGQGYAGKEVTLTVTPRVTQGNDDPERYLKIAKKITKTFTMPSDPKLVSKTVELVDMIKLEYHSLSEQKERKKKNKLKADKFKITYDVKIESAEEDFYPEDNQSQREMEVVTKKMKLLFIAGGPTREYRFILSQLSRPTLNEKIQRFEVQFDCSTLLQTAHQNSDQGMAKMLFELPQTMEEFNEYDCILCFDPNWQAFPEEQIKLLQRWVAEKSGGLIFIAGPVFMPEWTADLGSLDSSITSPLERIQNLLPVEFFISRNHKMTRAKYRTVTPLGLTYEGKRSKFLWLTDDEQTSLELWKSFPGIYNYFQVRRVKENARVYLRIKEPTLDPLDEEEVIENNDEESGIPYLIGQYYGKGRVLYLANGEMWRLRSLDVKFHEKLYSMMIQYVTENRLAIDSKYGFLAVDKEEAPPGETISIWAKLTSESSLYEYDEIKPIHTSPQSQSQQTITLRAIPGSTKTKKYIGQFTPYQEGIHQLMLLVPGKKAGTQDILQRKITILKPQQELKLAHRDATLLQEIAHKSSGHYYPTITASLSKQKAAPVKPSPDTSQPVPPKILPTLFEAIPASPYTITSPGLPDAAFDQLLRTWLIILIATFLSIEWLMRRLNKLA